MFPLRQINHIDFILSLNSSILFPFKHKAQLRRASRSSVTRSGSEGTFYICNLTIFIIRVTLNNFSDTLQFVKVGGSTKQLTKICDTSPERCVLGAVAKVGFILIDALLCLQSTGLKIAHFA